jgi:peroxiredoxin
VGADFTLTSVDGEEINLNGLRGSPVVLYYFATW